VSDEGIELSAYVEKLLTRRATRVPDWVLRLVFDGGLAIRVCGTWRGIAPRALRKEIAS
jgi:hypothetical protein